MTDETQQQEDKKPDSTVELEQLRQSIAALEAKNKELLSEKKKAKEEAEKAALDTAKNSGDLKALEDSYRSKLGAIASNLGVDVEQLSDASSRVALENQQLKSMVHGLTVGATATKLAANLAMDGCTDGLLPHISSRLTVDMSSGSAVIRVLDKDGKPTAMSVQELEQELRNTPYLAPLIRATSASGSGAKAGGGVATGGRKFSELSSAELVKLHRENPVEYQRLKSQG